MNAYVKTQSGPLNLRQAASTLSKILAQIPQNTKLEVEKVNDEWYKTSYNGRTGYVMSKYISQETNNTAFNKTDLENIYNSLKTTLSMIENILK